MKKITKGDIEAGLYHLDMTDLTELPRETRAKLAELLTFAGHGSTDVAECGLKDVDDEHVFAGLGDSSLGNVWGYSAGQVENNSVELTFIEFITAGLWPEPVPERTVTIDGKEISESTCAAALKAYLSD